MGIAAYLMGLSIPLIGGVALALLMLKMMQQTDDHAQHENTRSRSRRQESGFDEFRCRTKEEIFSNLDKCSICLETMNLENAQPLRCGHMFHSTCLVDLFMRNIKECPNCRAKIVEE